MSLSPASVLVHRSRRLAGTIRYPMLIFRMKDSVGMTRVVDWKPLIGRIFPTLGAAILFGFMSPAAHAEGGCPDGFFPIGGGTGGWQGCAPIPGYDDGGREEEPRQPTRSAYDNYYAAAWHRDSSWAWLVTGYSNRTRADRAALAACNAAMGSGCTTAAGGANGALVISRGVEGDLYAVSGADKGKAEKAMAKYCRDANDECEEIQWATAPALIAPSGQNVPESPRIYGPVNDPHRRYGALAWPDAGADGAPTREVWIVGGRPSRDKAASDVVALCQADSGKTCSVTLAGSDVYIALTMGDGVMGGAASASSATAAQKRALDLCRKTHKRCSKAGLFDLVAEQALRYDPEAFGKPWFTAQSWTKSGKAPWRNSVWSVSGAKDFDSAKKAALAACRAETKDECEAVSWSSNSKVALSVDAGGGPHVTWTAWPNDLEKAVAKDCAAQSLECRIVATIDSRVPSTGRTDVK
ncbi:DUF4189 domain-containing protein [Sphingopyxis sp.]|jgi:hypothetical protein|uniref:DUF4189 domain-containing protein n=1 Tax=Sphingopyxis sp. TaxID=1908224 RepID=UPI002586D3C0|nr:DUF4189 domain-containing protein [Sphingopyxis sp.]